VRAAVCCLEIGRKENALAFIEGNGYAKFWNTTYLFPTFSQKSMKMALKTLNYPT
jgi:hypothetical protein